MKQITEDYVTYETAVLLKEKGFDGNGDIGCKCGFYSQNIDYPNQIDLVYDDLDNSELEHNECLRPTHQLALKWLREVHGKNIIIEIVSDTDCLYRLWSFNVWDSNFAILWGEQRPKFEKYEQAVEAAIKYTLENLI